MYDQSVCNNRKRWNLMDNPIIEAGPQGEIKKLVQVCKIGQS